MRVLIVEDEPSIAQDIEDIALAEGFDIAGIATNAREAIELAPEADVAILDVRLTDGLTGPAIAKELVHRFKIGVVYLTGNPDLLRDQDVINVVTKPTDKQKVIEGLRKAAAWRREQTCRGAAPLDKSNGKH